MDRSTTLRAFYARYVTACAGAADPRIEAAFAAVPREPFAGPAPWFVRIRGAWSGQHSGAVYVQTPDDDPAFLYQDLLVALDPARRISIGQPSLHACCLDALSIRPEETIVQVGAGSGYCTAILAHLLGSAGHVHAFEIDPGLAVRARRNVTSWPWTTLQARSGSFDHLPNADVIHVNAGTTQPNQLWFDALRLVFGCRSRCSLAGNWAVCC